ANKQRLAWAKNQKNCQALDAVLADSEQFEREFFQASNPDESGLVDPRLLQDLWPNLRGKARKRSTRRLDHLLAEQQAEPENNWLFIDCLPALPIVDGAGAWLEEGCSVVWARCTLRPLAETQLGTTLDE